MSHRLRFQKLTRDKRPDPFNKSGSWRGLCRSHVDWVHCTVLERENKLKKINK